MFKFALTDRKFIFLLGFALSLKLFSLKESWVEQYYTYGLYPFISKSLRVLTGWITFSIGDLAYAGAGLYLMIVLFKALRLAFAKKVKTVLDWNLFFRIIKIALSIYIVFNAFWGLNYNRQGIAYQLGLNVESYTEEDLGQILAILQQRLCYYGERTDSIERIRLKEQEKLFEEGVKTYASIRNAMPFLSYDYPSLKASLYSPLGHYFGFTGYYNPFTSEAQLKTSIPVFLKPFVVCHEIGHQVGYAKENEANFVSFLACRQSENIEFRYSAYFEMYLYSLRELMRKDRRGGALLFMTAHPQVQKDYASFMAYLQRTDNKIEPYISQFYDRYLKLNNQPKGKATYNEVVAWLITYMKKYGAEAI